MIADPLVTNDPNRAALRAERALTFELLAARSPADVARVAARLLPASAERAWLSNVVRASLAELHREPAFKGRSPSGLERAAARTVARSAGTRWSRAKGLARLLRVAAAEVRARGTPGSGARASSEPCATRGSAAGVTATAPDPGLARAPNLGPSCRVAGFESFPAPRGARRTKPRRTPYCACAISAPKTLTAIGCGEAPTWS